MPGARGFCVLPIKPRGPLVQRTAVVFPPPKLERGSPLNTSTESGKAKANPPSKPAKTQPSKNTIASKSNDCKPAAPKKKTTSSQAKPSTSSEGKEKDKEKEEVKKEKKKKSSVCIIL